MIQQAFEAHSPSISKEERKKIEEEAEEEAEKKQQDKETSILVG